MDVICQSFSHANHAKNSCHAPYLVDNCQGAVSSLVFDRCLVINLQEISSYQVHLRLYAVHWWSCSLIERWSYEIWMNTSHALFVVVILLMLQQLLNAFIHVSSILLLDLCQLFSRYINCVWRNCVFIWHSTCYWKIGTESIISCFAAHVCLLAMTSSASFILEQSCTVRALEDLTEKLWAEIFTSWLV